LTVSGSGKCNIDSAAVAEETEIFRSPKWCGKVAERTDEYSAGLEEEIKKGQEEAAKLTEKIEKLRSEKLDVYDLGIPGILTTTTVLLTTDLLSLRMATRLSLLR
jgi:hypothetical protein